MSINQHNRKRDRFFLFAALAGFLLWLVSKSPVRGWADITFHQYSWLFGVLPSFLAAWTFAFWIAFAVKSKPVEAGLYAAALVIAAEFIELFIPIYTFDFYDMLAGVIGAAVAIPVLLLRERQKRQKLDL